MIALSLGVANRDNHCRGFGDTVVAWASGRLSSRGIGCHCHCAAITAVTILVVLWFVDSCLLFVVVGVGVDVEVLRSLALALTLDLESKSCAQSRAPSAKLNSNNRIIKEEDFTLIECATSR